MNNLENYQAPSVVDYEESDFWTFAPCGQD